MRYGNNLLARHLIYGKLCIYLICEDRGLSDEQNLRNLLQIMNRSYLCVLWTGLITGVRRTTPEKRLDIIHNSAVIMGYVEMLR